MWTEYNTVSDKDIIRVVNEFEDPHGELTIDGGSAGALIFGVFRSEPMSMRR